MRFFVESMILCRMMKQCSANIIEIYIITFSSFNYYFHIYHIYYNFLFFTSLRLFFSFLWEKCVDSSKNYFLIIMNVAGVYIFFIFFYILTGQFHDDT